MNALDWIFLAVLVLLGIRCMSRGFVEEVLSVAGLLVGLLAALVFYRGAGELFVRWGMSAQPAALPGIMGFAAVFLVGFLAMKLVERLISEGIEAAELGGIDRALGLVLGLAEGLLLISLVLVAMSLLEPAFKPLAGYSKLLRDSYFARVLLPIIGPEVARATQGIKAPELRLQLDPPAVKKP
jgi:membrane protein required for colicin V production